ncbi:hypothetical protein [Flavobacterium suncheonense]|uniref:TonB-dependent receptor n=1 Tax=Flavobacterium suncheonense GH29-5 = DSM 17707 TaxID=1121899 RepID=A0A0A2MAY2_9FLAO|nr:hypothetical protein [Flavobacterium suncheonense]KGO88791.1 hypothetical protein Q764_11185 [Flavobacterium suncheonense GH29-5 = DSM 17707]
MKQKLLFLLLLVFSAAWSQNPKILKGKVIADTKDLGGITVGNLTTHKEVFTASDGQFSIYAKAGDTLLFTSVQLKTRKIVVEKEDFDYLPFPVRLELKVTEIKEVVVEKSNIDAVSLGIIPYKVKPFTPAERRYYTANTGSGLVSVDAIINTISGRNAMLKKEIAAERNKMIQERLGNMFDADYLMTEFKIPEDYIDGFVVFASENPKVAKAVKDKNKTLTTFLLGGLAETYNKMITDAK